MIASGSDSEQDWGVSEDLVAPRQQKAAGTTTLDFDGLLLPPLKLHEDLAKGCGGQLWPAGMVLAKYCLRVQGRQLFNKSILELGAGAGIVGLAVARWLQDQGSENYGSTSIVMTDQECMLHLMHRNIELNCLAAPLIQGNVLDWGVESESSFDTPDVLLAADCVYFEPAFPLLMQEMKRLIGPNTTCYFCMKKRRKADLRFIKDMRKSFNVRDVDDDPDKVVWAREGLYL